MKSPTTPKGLVTTVDPPLKGKRNELGLLLAVGLVALSSCASSNGTGTVTGTFRPLVVHRVITLIDWPAM